MEFIKRWWKWVIAALGILVALSAGRRANIRLGRANKTIQDNAAKDISERWNDVDSSVESFLGAQKKAKQANDKLNKQLDSIAQSDQAASDIISDWNADNRLSDDL